MPRIAEITTTHDGRPCVVIEPTGDVGAVSLYTPAEIDALVRAEVERLRKALAEIVVRTMPHQDDHEGWPLVAGVHRVAHDALADSN
jgi:hypothetical protein